MSDTGDGSQAEGNEQDARFGEILNDFLDRRARGEAVSEAELYADGQPIGRGIAVAHLDRTTSHIIEARYQGRVGHAQVASTTNGGVVALDIIGGIFWLIPFIGLAGPGAKKLTTQSVAVSVPPAN